MTEAEPGYIADELAIRRVLDEYCLRLEANAFADWLDLFTEDATYEVYRKVLRGRQEIADLLSGAPHGVHLPGAARIAIDGDRADTLQNYLFIANSTDEWNAGWYLRELVRTAGGWKITRTVVKFARKDSLRENERARQVSFPIRFA